MRQRAELIAAMLEVVAEAMDENAPSYVVVDTDNRVIHVTKLMLNAAAELRALIAN
jgi:hypothetical protein